MMSTRRKAVGLAAGLLAVSFGANAFAYGEPDANGFPNWAERVLLEWSVALPRHV